MPAAKLYNLHIRSADTTTSTDLFLENQRRMTGGVKRHIKAELEARGLSGQFAFAASRVPGHARSAQVYATPAALKVLQGVKDVEKLEPMVSSMYALKREM